MATPARGSSPPPAAAAVAPPAGGSPVPGSAPAAASPPPAAGGGGSGAGDGSGAGVAVQRRWRSAVRATTDVLTGGMKGRVRIENKLSELVAHAMTEKGLGKVVAILQLAPARRTEAQIRQCVRFLTKHQFAIKFFRNKRRAQIEQLCRVMTVSVCGPNQLLFEQGDQALHAYVVVEGRAGSFIPEDHKSVSEYEAYMHRMRVLALAGKLNSGLADTQTELDRVKTAVGLPTAEALADAPTALGPLRSPAGAGGLASLDTLPEDGERPVTAESGVNRSHGHVPGTRWYDEDEEAESDGELADDIGGGRPMSGATHGSVRRRDPQLLWQWAFRKITTMMRTGAALLDLATFARKHDGTKFCQVQLHRKGDVFGDLDLFHRLRRRTATVWTKTDSVFFMIPHDAYAELRAAEATTGDLIDDVAFLTELPWLHGCAPDAVVRLAHECKKVVVSRGTVIVAEGTTDPTVVIIKSGSVRVECRGGNRERKGSMLPAGLPYHLGLLSVGEWFGDKPILTNSANDFSFVADTSCVLMVVGARAFFPHQRRAMPILMEHLRQMTTHHTQRLLAMSVAKKSHAVGLRLHTSAAAVTAAARTESNQSDDTGATVTPIGAAADSRQSRQSFLKKPANAAFPLRSTPSSGDGAHATFAAASPATRLKSLAVSESAPVLLSGIGSRPKSSPSTNAARAKATMSSAIAVHVASTPATRSEPSSSSSSSSPTTATPRANSRAATEVALLGFCRPSASVFARPAGMSPSASARSLLRRGSPSAVSTAAPPTTSMAFSPSESTVSLSPSMTLAQSGRRRMAAGEGFVGKGRSHPVPESPSYKPKFVTSPSAAAGSAAGGGIASAHGGSPVAAGKAVVSPVAASPSAAVWRRRGASRFGSGSSRRGGSGSARKLRLGGLGGTSSSSSSPSVPRDIRGFLSQHREVAALH